MSYFNYDPFFGNEDNNEKEPQEPKKTNIDPFGDDNNSTEKPTVFFGTADNGENFKAEIKSEDEPPKSEPKSATSSNSDNSGFGAFDGFNGGSGGNFGGNDYHERARRQHGIGLIIAIIIPILIITNIFTSIIVFNSVWSEAKAEFQAQLDAAISKETNLTIDTTSILAYNVAKTQLKNVVEINVTTSTGGASGTGFILTESGYILTNAHVITYTQTYRTGIGPNAVTQTKTAIADTINCKFANNDTTYTVEVIDYDLDLDIALCKIVNAPSNLVAVKFADSTLLQYGEPCVAIGNAEGYGLAVTEGIVSSPIQYFNLSGKSGTTAAIQHSAAINPGNSGGPLFNMYGLVVGINTFKLISDSDVGTDGMGFAIPSAVVKDYVNGLNVNGVTISYTTYSASSTGLSEAA